MPRYIALFRAINVGGHTVKMELLRTLFGEMGFDDVSTFIASGNVVFTCGEEDAAALEERIEQHLHNSLGYEVVTFIRTPDELRTMMEELPFSASEIADAGALNVAFLKALMSPEQEAGLQKLTTEIDTFRTFGREVFWHCLKKQSESTFSNAVLERTLSLRATFRGINSLRKLLVILQ